MDVVESKRKGGSILNSVWLFVLAAVIAVIGILAVFRNYMGKLQGIIEADKDMDMGAIGREQTQFFIKVAMVEVVPIMLIVLGFLFMDSTGEYNPLIPIVIIVAVLLFALLQVFNIRRNMIGYNEAPTQIQPIVTTMCFIGVAFMTAFPIIAIIALTIM